MLTKEEILAKYNINSLLDVKNIKLKILIVGEVI